MTIYTIRVLDMLERIVRFFLDRTITPAIPRVTAAQAEVTTTITALRAAAQKQTTGASESSGGVDTRLSTLRALRKALRNVNRTGRVLDRVHPGIAATFKLPTTNGSARLLAAAEAIHAKATELETDFVASGLDATFLTELSDLIAAFRAATSKKQDGGALRSGSTADLKAKTKIGLDAAIELDAYVRNHFRNDPEALGAWEFSRHIERNSVPTSDPTDPPPSGSGGSGSGTTPTAG